MAETSNSTGAGAGAARKIVDVTRPLGGRLALSLRHPPSDGFDAKRWLYEWARFVGTAGTRTGRLVLVFSRQLRSPERMRLLKELRAVPGAVAAVLEEQRADLQRGEWVTL